MKNKITSVSLFLFFTIFNLNAQYIKINEVRHYATYSPTGTFMPSFVELYNTAESSIDIGNYKIYNNQDSLLVDLPSGINIPAKGYLTILMKEGVNDLSFNENEAVYFTQGDSLNLFNANKGATGLYDINNK